MSDEQPVAIKKRKIQPPVVGQVACIIHYERHNKLEDITPLTVQSFDTIRRCASIRQSAATEVHRLDSICAKIPTNLDSAVHGYHRWCYCSFTNVSKLSKMSETLLGASYSANTQSRQSFRCSTANQHILLPQNECLFCDKRRKKSCAGEEVLSKCVCKNAEQKIKECAKTKNDFTLMGKIEGFDLLAKEARYHESCRKAYVRSASRSHHSKADSLAGKNTYGTAEQRAAYEAAFQDLCEHINVNIIQGGSVERMTMLRERYLNHILLNSPQVYNENHKTDKLKDKMCKHFGEKIQFWRPNNKSDLVYSSGVNTGEAVELAFEAATSEMKVLEEAASVLRRHISSGNFENKTMPWPPSSDYLRSNMDSMPSPILDFLALVISGKKYAFSSSKTVRLSRSFAQDLCGAATQGKWKTSKHLLLATTIRALNGGAKLQTILNRFGHCVSHSVSLELETAMANQVQVSRSQVPTNIIINANKVSHLVWDNFDINEETPSGAGTTHTTHGIVVQEVIPNTNLNQDSTCLSITKTKQRSCNCTPITLPPCFSKKRVEPSFSQSDSSKVELLNMLPQAAIKDVSNTSLPKELLLGPFWVLCRTFFNTNNTVPEWAGWISKMSTEDTNCSQSNIGYMSPILHPITEYQTVQQCLVTSVEVTETLKQDFTFITMDLAAAKIAYDIIWDSGDRFSKVILNLGPFHTMCSYMGSIGKMMAGSGFEEILIESGICASGSIDQVMSGKHYNRAMHVHQRMLDTLERLLIDVFITEEHQKVDLQQLLGTKNLANAPSHENFTAATMCDSSSDFIKSYDNFKEQVRNGLLGKTGQVWISYCDCVWTLLGFQMAVKTNNFNLYLSSIRDMCGLLFSSNHLHYARYLPAYYIQLCNLPESHPGANLLLQSNGFSSSRSTVPGCRIAMDMTIEQTINKSAKMPGGIIGFSRNTSAYYRWCVTRHKRAAYVEATLAELDMTNNCEDGHKSNRVSQIKKSECEVSSIKTAFQQFTNPFTLNGSAKDQLLCISSGQPANENVSRDMLKYVKSGNNAASAFMESRLVNKTIKFHEPLTRSKLLTFQSMAIKRTLTATQKKTIEIRADRNMLGNMLLLSQQHNLSLEKLLCYPLGPIPWALSTADGAFVKTDKSQLLHVLEEKVTAATVPQITLSTYIMDGNALFQAATHLPDTFEEFARKIFLSLPKCPVLHFVTDSYNSSSIKEQERLRRAASTSASDYELGGSKTKMPRDFKSFLSSGNNKRQLTQFVLRQWKSQEYASLLRDRKIYFVCEEQCICLESSDGLGVSHKTINNLRTTQEEADTRIILHCLHAAHNTSPDTSIVIRSPDTDVFILLISYSNNVEQRLLFDTGSGNHRRLINIHEVASSIGHNVSLALPAFHAFTGCDTTSSFVRKGKKTPLKVMISNPTFIDLFTSFGSDIDWINDETLKQVQSFVCSMYGRPTFTDINNLRYETFKGRYEPTASNSALTLKNGIDLSLLPPCKSTLRMHCLRSNYQAFIWKNSHKADMTLPSPIGNGWEEACESGPLIVKWTDGDVMPQQLVDILASTEEQPTNTITDEQEHEQLWHSEIIEVDDEVDNILDVMYEDEEAE